MRFEVYGSSVGSFTSFPLSRRVGTAFSLLAGLRFGFALAHGDLHFAAFWRCHRRTEAKKLDQRSVGDEERRSLHRVRLINGMASVWVMAATYKRQPRQARSN